MEKNIMRLEISKKARAELRAGGFGSAAYLRLAVKPGGCAGMSYDMILDNKRHAGDKIIYEIGDLQVIADPDSAPYLDGLKIDYSDDLIQAGFSLKNPSDQNTCGCGSSFNCS